MFYCFYCFSSYTAELQFAKCLMCGLKVKFLLALIKSLHDSKLKKCMFMEKRSKYLNMF